MIVLNKVSCTAVIKHKRKLKSLNVKAERNSKSACIGFMRMRMSYAGANVNLVRCVRACRCVCVHVVALHELFALFLIKNKNKLDVSC